jgi:hypothetical protein
MSIRPNIRRSRPWGPGGVPPDSVCFSSKCQLYMPQTFVLVLFFQKRSKSVSSASQRCPSHPKFGEADQGVWGRAPRNCVILQSVDYVSQTFVLVLLFQKRSKSVSSASQRCLSHPKFGEADPGGLEACPQKLYDSSKC